MFENTNLPWVVRVKSTTPVTDNLEAFDMMSRFLAFEKAKQLSHDFAGQAYLASSSQIWNDLRLACNSLLEKNDPRRDPVAPWKEQQLEETNETLATPMSIKAESTRDDDASSDNDEESPASDIAKKEKSEKKSAKKAKKEAKKMKKAAKKAAKKERKEKKKKHKDEGA